MSKRAIIYGAGRIGCCVGQCLLQAGWHVLFVGHSDRMLKELADNDNKLQLSDFRGAESSFTYSGLPDDIFTFTKNLQTEDVKPHDYVIVTVKRAASQDVADHLKSLQIQVPYQLVAFQNGVNTTQVYRDTLTEQPPTFIAAIFGANVIKEDDKPSFRLATTNPALIEQKGHEMSNALKEALEWGSQHQQPYVDCEVHEDIESLMYGKLLLNLNNAVNALTGLPLKDELAERSCRKVLANCISEAIHAMEANGISPAALHPLMQPKLLPMVMKLPSFLYLRLASSSLQVDPSARSSMWDDLSSGGHTEIDYLNGVVIELGKKGNVPTPVNQRVYDLVKEAEQKKSSPSYSPDELLELTVQ